MKISSYLTTRNCITLDYSFKECIESLLQFSDEVVVGDSSDGSDGTLDALNAIADTNPKVKVFHKDLDYSVPNYGIFDGQMKDFARSHCTGDWLVQVDADEAFHELDAPKIRSFLSRIPSDIQVIAAPVIEYWGSLDKVRIDVTCWKWRYSRNNPDIGHGLPNDQRVHRNGLVYSKGSDGCDMIHKSTGERVQFSTFITPQTEALRQLAIKDKRYVTAYEQWIEMVIDQIPGVFHFSWYSIERKIETYKKYWNKHWKSLYGQDLTDDNMFFDVPWSQVTSEMVKAKAKELREETGGHVFHTKWNPSNKTNAIQVPRSVPTTFKAWAERHADS